MSSNGGRRSAAPFICAAILRNVQYRRGFLGFFALKFPPMLEFYRLHVGSAIWHLRHKLRRIVEKLLLSDTITFPALPGNLFDARCAPVQPRELEHPANDDGIAIDEYRSDAARFYLPRRRHDLALIGDKRGAAGSRASTHLPCRTLRSPRHAHFFQPAQ